MGTFDLTLGPLLLGLSLNLYLHGVVSYQYMSYATMKFNDPIWLQVLVALLFVLDTSQTYVEVYGVWYFAVENYTNPSVLSDIIWITPFCVVATAVSTLIVQAFLIRRLCLLTRQVWLCAPLLMAAVAASLCAIATTPRAWIIGDLSKFSVLIPLNTAWLCLEAGVDIIVTVTLSRVLWKSKTGLARTDTVINRCVKAAIQSGLFSSVFAVLHFLAFIFWSENYLYAIFHWPLGRIYSNSLIYTLVARKDLAKIADGKVDSRSNTFPISSLRFKRETATDPKLINSGVKASLDRNIVFPISQDTASSH
ncbi:hypothetical protein DL96DRAFT_110423 [Flagelloscypha sp. PMI_526]|nr:hypothetical protein DL96DRAFT_110423 [Flagelloscypha sp. PMI_526]